MDVILDEFRKNGIDIDETTLSYFINKTYNDYQSVYERFLGTLSYEGLFIVWRRMRPEMFGHVVVFLTTVHLQDLSENETRYVVRLTVPVLKNIDISKNKREKSILDNYTLVRNIVHRFLHRYVCRRLDPVLCYCYIIGNVIGTFAKR